MAWIDWKVKAKQSTTVAHLEQLLQESRAEQSSIYIQSLLERMPTICETVIAAKEGRFDEWKIEDFFVFFLFSSYLMRLKKTCI